jgi:hypothetical protein
MESEYQTIMTIRGSNTGLSSLPVICNQTATNRSCCGNHVTVMLHIVSNLIADTRTHVRDTSLSGQLFKI